MIWHNLDQQQKVALALSVAVNALAVGILLAVGMSEPLKPPARIKAVLLNAEDVKALQNASETDLSNPNIAKEAQTRPSPTSVISTAKPQVEPEPVTQPEPQPTAKTEPPKTAPSTPEKAAPSKASEQVDPTLAARLRAEKAVRDAKLRAADNLKKEQAEKNKQLAAEKLALEKAKKDSPKKPKEKNNDQIAQKLKDDAERARKNAEAEEKAKAQRLKDLENELKGVGQPANENAGPTKGEIKTMVGNAKRDFEKKIYRTWKPPFDAKGKSIKVRFSLTNNGAVKSVVITGGGGDENLEASIKQAIMDAQNYTLPENPDARKQALSVEATFTVK